MNGGVGVCTRDIGLEGSHLKPLCGEDPNISFFSIFIYLVVCVLIVAHLDLSPLLWHVGSRSASRD